MPLRLLPASGYSTQPWKNGLGSTDEIALLPEGATRDAFGLRISRADIPGPGRFSSFPGVERAITVIDGAGLVLDFGERVVELVPERPFLFDSGLMPVGTPLGGPVRVLNVMAARARWQIGAADVHGGPAICDPGPGGIGVLFAIRGTARLVAPAEEVVLDQGDTAIIEDITRIVPEGSGGAILQVTLTLPTRP